MGGFIALDTQSMKELTNTRIEANVTIQFKQQIGL